eukprot:CFRG5306T1
MAFSIMDLLVAILLAVNGIAVLHEDRFLKKFGLGYQQSQPTGFDGQESGAKQKIAALIYAVRTLTRIPLIGLNVIVIVFKIVLG